MQHQAGVRAQAPTPQDLAASVQQTAGVPLSQVTAVNVCAQPQAGHAACAAQQSAPRSSHRLVHPHVRAHPTFTQVFPAPPPRRRARRRARPPRLRRARCHPLRRAPPRPARPPTSSRPTTSPTVHRRRGPGDTVAIVDAGDDLNAQGDLATYRSTYGLPPCTTGNGCFAKVNQTGGASPLPSPAGSDWEAEMSLDLDAVSALCPNCHILLVENQQLADHRPGRRSPPRPSLSAPTRSPTAGPAPPARPSARAPSRAPPRSSPRPAITATSRRGGGQLPRRLPRRHRRRRHHARRRRRRHQQPRLHRVGVVAQQLRSGLGRRLRVRHPRAQARLSVRHRLRGPLLCRRLGPLRQSRHGPAGL